MPVRSPAAAGLMRERDRNPVVTSNYGSVAGTLMETNPAFHDESRRRPGGSSYEEPVGWNRYPGTGSGQKTGGGPVTAGDLTTRPAITVAPVSTHPYSVNLMQSEQVNNLVVVEHEHPCGDTKTR